MLKLREQARGRSSRKLQLIFARSSSTEGIRVRSLPFGRFDTGAPRTPDESLNSLSPSRTASQKHPRYNEGFPLFFFCLSALDLFLLVTLCVLRDRQRICTRDIGKLLLFHIFSETVKRQKLANTDGSHVRFDLLITFVQFRPFHFSKYKKVHSKKETPSSKKEKL